MACANHPSKLESYCCTRCGAFWCAACVRTVTIAGGVVCPRCGHAVDKASPAISAADSIRDAVRRVASVEGVTTAAGFAFAYMLARWVSVFAIFYLSALVGYYFTIIHHVGDGRDGLPGPSDATEDFFDVAGFAARGILCAGLGLLPWLGWVLVAHDPPRGALAIALLVVGQMYMPAALLAVVFSSNGLAAAWPPAWIAVISRAPQAYLRFVGLWLGSVMVGAALCVATLGVLGDAMLGGAWLAATVWGLYWFVQAGLVGNFIRSNAGRFSW